MFYENFTEIIKIKKCKYFHIQNEKINKKRHHHIIVATIRFSFHGELKIIYDFEINQLNDSVTSYN